MKSLIYDMEYSDIQNKIIEYLPVRETEKNEFGEVFTPIKLIEEMLDKLPKNVWKNPELKWLDPANGIGNFPMVIYKNLMKGLEDWEPNDVIRHKHIIENMLYMIEINPKNETISKTIFGNNANICCANFLEDEEKWKEQFGVYTFDIIIGNPPYNKGGIRTKLKLTKKETKTIWPIFVEKSLLILKDKTGFLLFIHPASWISLQHSRSDLILSRQIIYLHYYNVMASHKLFGNQSGEIPLTYYLLQNINSKDDTIIFDNCLKKDIKYNIYKNNFIPTESISIFKKLFILRNKYGNLNDKYYNTKRPDEELVSSNYTSKYKYPLISIRNKELNIIFYNTNLSKTNEKKLIFPNFSMGYPILDEYGILYPSSNMKHNLVYDNNTKKLKQIQNMFYTNLVFYIINTLKTKQKFFNNKIFEILPDITNITNEIDIDDNYLCDLLKLTDEDKHCIDTYSSSGEGRLTNEKIHQFKNFNMTKYIPNFKLTAYPSINKEQFVIKIQAMIRGFQERKKILEEQSPTFQYIIK